MLDKEDGFSNELNLLGVYVGEKKQAYYLKRFQEFEKNGSASATWHWPALFVTFWWLLYRKMWSFAVVYFVILIIVRSMPANFFSFVISIALLVGPALFANAVYYHHCKKKVREAQQELSDDSAIVERLLVTGGVSRPVPIVAIVLSLIFFLGVVFAVAIPAYQDYLLRGKATQAFQQANAVKMQVEEYFSQNQQMPVTLNVSKPSIGVIDNLSVVDGKIEVQLSNELHNKYFYLIPRVDSTRLVWRCESDKTIQRYLPKECRN